MWLLLEGYECLPSKQLQQQQQQHTANSTSMYAPYRKLFSKNGIVGDFCLKKKHNTYQH